MSREFRAFKKMTRLNKLEVHVTQKIHGTNAQIVIYVKEDGTIDLLTGSRTRWIFPDDDNFGFAAFVHANKQVFIELLGLGEHYGEWAGPGINSGEGLTEKTFVLFDFWKYPPGRPLPPQTKVVPVLYSGPLDTANIEEVMVDLKARGSKLVPGFMRPEGIVVSIGDTRYKQVFEAEETQWKSGDGNKDRIRAMSAGVDYSYLCQPMRLEKLLSRDECYLRQLPESLPTIVKDYFADLVAEGQIVGSPDEVKAIRKGASSFIFTFVKKAVGL